MLETNENGVNDNDKFFGNTIYSSMCKSNK